MKVWIDPDLCTGDGICAEIAPEVFYMADDGLAYVKEVGKVALDGKGQPINVGLPGIVGVPDRLIEDVIESAEECPGECIFIED